MMASVLPEGFPCGTDATGLTCSVGRVAEFLLLDRPAPDSDVGGRMGRDPQGRRHRDPGDHGAVVKLVVARAMAPPADAEVTRT